MELMCKHCIVSTHNIFFHFFFSFQRSLERTGLHQFANILCHLWLAFVYVVGINFYYSQPHSCCGKLHVRPEHDVSDTQSVRQCAGVHAKHWSGTDRSDKNNW